MKKRLHKVGKKAHRFGEIVYDHYGISLVIISVLIILIIELASRHSLIGSIEFMIKSPLVFICNALIILATISISLLFRKRAFVLSLISIMWIALGVVNGIILSNRMTPFNTKDLSNLKEAQSIMANYFSPGKIALMCLAAAIVVFLIILLYRKTPKLKTKVNFKKSIAAIIILIAVAFGSVTAGMKVGVLDTFFASLPIAFKDNGFVYSFIVTTVKTGIDKPRHYSEEMIEGIFDKGELGKDKIYDPVKDEDLKAADENNKPNIIFLQLESFIDLDRVNAIKLSQDATPNFRKLMKEYSSGYLEVPAVGAGTANVEFEAITGISARFFGPGEYPYKSVLTENTCESIPYDLSLIGYKSHAIHNHRGAFYNRNTVFSNLGFDTFTCLEYMNNVVKTPKNWAKDALLTENIIDAMKSTKNPDYIYTISVQGHGKYPTEEVIEDPVIQVTEAPDEELKWAYEYYANQIYEMDIFVKELTEALENYDEDVVLVMYGDHLPALDITDDQIDTNDVYQSQYIIWDNFGLSKKDKDTYAYELGPEVLERLGINVGLLTKYHQNYRGEKNYEKNLKTLSYDMLYGKNYIYGQQNPYSPTKLQMGVNKIEIEEVVQIGDKYYIKGKNFTEYSKISLDGRILKTVYLGPTILALNEEVDPSEAPNMKVSQVEKNKEILSTTE
ncbi:MAG: LTA synthase family protein [Firmicutes bacterium]|nr:LTA synthase family protein [Bacillota bacterium]